MNRKLIARDIHEQNRVSSPLELFFDLTFVVAVAIGSQQMHDQISAGQGLGSIIPYLFVFFGSWWAWMNFTWFASAYGRDDSIFRLLTMLQMIGVLIFSVGIPDLFSSTVSYLGVAGYAIMRIALVIQWFRAANGDPTRKKTCLRYAYGVLFVQALWILRIWFPPTWVFPTFLLFVFLEFAVPVFAEKAKATTWHPHHIAERYSSFTIIAIGECVLGISNTISSVVQAEGVSIDLALTSVGSMALIFGLWWLYFLLPSGEALHKHRERAFVWGYLHYFIFASLAAVGTGLTVAADIYKKNALATTAQAVLLIGLS